MFGAPGSLALKNLHMLHFIPYPAPYKFAQSLPQARARTCNRQRAPPALFHELLFYCEYLLAPPVDCICHGDSNKV
jgi:hypothetical protein